MARDIPKPSQRRWRFQMPALKVRWPIRRWTADEWYASLTEAQREAWWDECPCGCDIPMSDPAYPPAHGAGEPDA